MWIDCLRNLFRFLRPAARLSPQSPQPPVAQLQLRSAVPVCETDERYLSFSIDISLLAGGYWWDGSSGTRKGLGTLRVPPLDLNSPKLDRLVVALGPSYLRVGGSEADKIHYFEAPSDEQDSLVLTRRMWDDLHAFVQRNNLKFFFTIKYGLFKRRQHGVWQGTEIQQLLEYSKQHNYLIDVCELGNELNAYWAFHGLLSQPRAKNLAQDYSTFAQLIRRYYPAVRICGPGSAFWPRLGETIKPFSNITEKFLASLSFQLDIVDWHYYPFQSNRSPLRTRAATQKSVLAPRSFKAFKVYSRRLQKLRDLYQPDAELWTGETGSAQCGGQPKISDRFMSSFWWADQLGQGALLGHRVMIRQSLIGGDYGMIHRLTLKPRPDFWVSWLWRQLMGVQVYDVDCEQSGLRAYCHQHKHSDDWCLLLVNLSETEVAIDLQRFFAAGDNSAGTSGRAALHTARVLESYRLSAKKPDAKKVLINGMRPKFRQGRVTLADFPQPAAPDSVAPLTINFWRIGRVGGLGTLRQETVDSIPDRQVQSDNVGVEAV